MRVADYIIEFLENHGVGHIFTVVGGGSIFLNDAVGIAKKMKYVATHHERRQAPKAQNLRNADGTMKKTLNLNSLGVYTCKKKH